jgi:hypothetical protein
MDFKSNRMVEEKEEIKTIESAEKKTKGKAKSKVAVAETTAQKQPAKRGRKPKTTN